MWSPISAQATAESVRVYYAHNVKHPNESIVEREHNTSPLAKSEGRVHGKQGGRTRIGTSVSGKNRYFS